MNRRDFLKVSSNAYLAGQTQDALSYANNFEAPNLLVVMLRGAADSLSMLIPYSDSFYHEQRPIISIKEPHYLKINDTFAVNKSLEKFFYQSYIDNNAVFVPLSGQKNKSRSHFLSQDIMEYGVADVDRYESGFLNRLYEVTQLKTVSFTYDLTPICMGKTIIPNIVLKYLDTSINDHYYNSLKNIYEEDKVLSDYLDIIHGNNQSLTQLNTPFISGGAKESNRLGKIASFMKMNHIKTGFVDFTNWDTHAAQGSTSGLLDNLMKNLDQELFEFKQNLGQEQWNNTLVVVMSEFGRRVKQNGNGCDHGNAGLFSLMGGLISQSKIAGDWLGLHPDKLNEKRDLPMLYDYRDILANVFVKMYGLNQQQIEHVFPGLTPSRLSLI